MQEVNPIDWAMLPLKRYADFKGRAARAEYWWFVLAYSVIQLVFMFIDAKFTPTIYGAYGPLRLALTVTLLVPIYAVTVRRLHDTEKSAWWVLPRISSLAFLLFPLLHVDQSIFEQLSGWSLATAIVLFLGWACAEIALFVFMVTRGTSGTNRYGPDPYGPDELQEVFA